MKKNRIFTVSNLISLSRIFLMIPIIHLFRSNTPNAKIYLFLLMVLAILTDLLDGFLARWLNQVSELGKIFDPVADKICIGLMTVFLVIYRDLPLWFVIVVISRDLIILCCSLLVINKQKRIMQSTLVGKLTSFFLSLTILAYTFEVVQVQLYLLLISILMILGTLVSYGRRFLQMLNESPLQMADANIRQINIVEQSFPIGEYDKNKVSNGKPTEKVLK